MKTAHDPIKDTILLFGSRAQACKALGVSSQAISNWRRDGMPATRKLQVIRMAIERGMNIPPSLLFEEGDEPGEGAQRPLCLESV